MSIKDKYQALKKIEDGTKTKNSVADEYGVAKNTLSTCIANKNKIYATYESGEISAKRNKMKKSDYNDLDKAVFIWFRNARANNIPVAGALVQEKARSLAQNLDLTDFNASDGGLEKWKLRHNVTFKSVAGEKNACTPEMAACWKETHLPTILSRYELKDIFNTDEFGLFYQAMPNKSLHFKGERCAGENTAK